MFHIRKELNLYALDEHRHFIVLMAVYTQYVPCTVQYQFIRSRDVAIDTATRLRAGRSGFRIAAGRRKIVSSSEHPDQPWGPPILLFHDDLVLNRG